MKLKYILTIILLSATQVSFACDACGCANSGSYFGLMPQSNKSIIGVRYQNLNFVAHPESHVLRTEETFHVSELYVRFFPIKRVQVMAFMPYRFSKQVTTSETKKQKGLGDATLLVNYNIINSFMDSESDAKFSHTLLFGGGVKLPSGKFKYDENNVADVANPNFQLGTGTTDFILNAFYTINKEQWGLATNVSRKFNTTNSDNYRFGDQLYGTIDLYRSFTIKTLTITPNVGLYAENSDLGKRNNIEILETGGKLLNGTVGLSFFTNRWTLGLSAQKPISQKLSAGFVEAKSRGMIQLGWIF